MIVVFLLVEYNKKFISSQMFAESKFFTKSMFTKSKVNCNCSGTARRRTTPLKLPAR